MKMFFFGVGPNDSAGHFLHDENLYKVWGGAQEKVIPFTYTILDGGLIPPTALQAQGSSHLSHINGWTVITMPDFSADKRGGCSASFVVEGIFSKAEMFELCSAKFPKLWSRIKPN